MGAARIPGTITCSPAFRLLLVRLPFALRIASASSPEVRYDVRFTYWRASEPTLSPRLASYSSVPGGANTGCRSAGFGMGVVAGALLRTILGDCCAAAVGVSETKDQSRTIRIPARKTPKAKERSPRRRKGFSQKWFWGGY